MRYELDNSSACQYIFKIYSLCLNIILRQQTLASKVQLYQQLSFTLSVYYRGLSYLLMLEKNAKSQRYFMLEITCEARILINIMGEFCRQI